MIIKCHKPLGKGQGHYFMQGSFPSAFSNSVFFLCAFQPREMLLGAQQRGLPMTRSASGVTPQPLGLFLCYLQLHHFLWLVDTLENCYPFSVCKVACTGSHDRDLGEVGHTLAIEGKHCRFPSKDTNCALFTIFKSLRGHQHFREPVGSSKLVQDILLLQF